MKTKDIGPEGQRNPLSSIKSEWHLVSRLAVNPCAPSSGEACVKVVWGKMVKENGASLIVPSASRSPNERFITQSQLNDSFHTSLFNAVGIRESLQKSVCMHLGSKKENIVTLRKIRVEPTLQMAAQQPQTKQLR